LILFAERYGELERVRRENGLPKMRVNPTIALNFTETQTKKETDERYFVSRVKSPQEY
jgi:hypothetical protein